MVKGILIKHFKCFKIVIYLNNKIIQKSHKFYIQFYNLMKLEINKFQYTKICEIFHLIIFIKIYIFNNIFYIKKFKKL